MCKMTTHGENCLSHIVWMPLVWHVLRITKLVRHGGALFIHCASLFTKRWYSHEKEAPKVLIVITLNWFYMYVMDIYCIHFTPASLSLFLLSIQNEWTQKSVMLKLNIILNSFDIISRLCCCPSIISLLLWLCKLN